MGEYNLKEDGRTGNVTWEEIYGVSNQVTSQQTIQEFKAEEFEDDEIWCDLGDDVDRHDDVFVYTGHILQKDDGNVVLEGTYVWHNHGAKGTFKYTLKPLYRFKCTKSARK